MARFLWKHLEFHFDLDHFTIISIVYWNTERVSIFEFYYENSRCTVAGWAYEPIRDQFWEAGWLANRKEPRQMKLWETKLWKLLWWATLVSILCEVSVSGICRMSIQTIQLFHKFHLYKVHLTQELNEDDLERRSELCEIMCVPIINQPNWLFLTWMFLWTILLISPHSQITIAHTI